MSRMRGIAAVLVFAAALEAGVEMRCRAVSGGKAGRRVKKPKGAEGYKGAGQFLKEADRFNGAERFLKKAGSFNGAERFLKKAGSFNRAEKLFLAVILTMVFVQLARINLMPDYDSLHYGLRSHYILDAGHGIYEDCAWGCAVRRLGLSDQQKNNDRAFLRDADLPDSGNNEYGDNGKK